MRVLVYYLSATNAKEKNLMEHVIREMEACFGEEMEKIASPADFKDAPSHGFKRRFAEYYSAQTLKWGGLEQFTYAHNPIEKFKDIPAVFTLALYQDHVAVGPQEKGSVRHQYTDVINGIIECINKNVVHPYLLDLLDRGNHPLYDNHIVAEVVDYRGAVVRSNRVLLKITYGGISFLPSLLLQFKCDEESEAAIIAKTHSICIDPDPVLFEISKHYDYNKKKLDFVRCTAKKKKKYILSGVISDFRRMQKSQEREVFAGLERAGTGRIYRTVKYVSGSIHYSVNAVMGPGWIEIIFRKGLVPDTSIGGFTARRKFVSPAQIDLYFANVKKILEIHHTDLRCVFDMSNGMKAKKESRSPEPRSREHRMSMAGTGRIQPIAPEFSEKRNVSITIPPGVPRGWVSHGAVLGEGRDGLGSSVNTASVAGTFTSRINGAPISPALTLTPGQRMPRSLVPRRGREWGDGAFCPGRRPEPAPPTVGQTQKRPWQPPRESESSKSLDEFNFDYANNKFV
jgi:hypothetical protein